MIILYHNKSKITAIVAPETSHFPNEIGRDVVSVLLDFANKFEDEIVVWCHEDAKENLNKAAIESLFHHKKLLFSYTTLPDNYFNRRLGYIEDTPYIKVNKTIRSATWQMSSQVGAVHTSVINACKADLKVEKNFDYFLNSLAKRALPFGLFCYSEPTLLLQKKESEHKSAGLWELFKFTKQHYKTRWVLLLFLNLVLYEKKVPLLPMVFSLFYKRRNFNPEKLNQIPLQSNKKIIEVGTIDVLIPTIGRKEYLLNVLTNLASQTHLPKNVIVIEQNPLENSQSELDFIEGKEWPFTIKHHFTHQTGACNARNIGLEWVESEYCFFADDDIVFDNDLLEKTMQTFQATGNEVLLVAIHLAGEKIIEQSPRQFPAFGTCHAFVKSSCIKGLKFNMAFEFGYGEDNDFGMQLRKRGFDILYISTSKILHFKAPMGGFRTRPVLQWQEDIIQPKPSPTVMLFLLLHVSKEQLQSYKLTLFFKNLDKNFVLNPFKYVNVFKQKWNRSVHWATVLNKQ